MNFLRWYSTHGIPSPKTGKIKPFLGGGRRPKGEEHQRVQSGVFYRVPLYQDSHVTLDEGDALCGRLLDVDPMWWVDSGWAEAIGEWYFIPDTRKTGHCGPCSAELKAIEARGEMPEPKKPQSPFIKTDEPQARNIAALDRMKMNGIVFFVLRAFPGSEVV
jgi:hypothetical protein